MATTAAAAAKTTTGEQKKNEPSLMGAGIGRVNLF